MPEPLLLKNFRSGPVQWSILGVGIPQMDIGRHSAIEKSPLTLINSIPFLLARMVRNLLENSLFILS